MPQRHNKVQQTKPTSFFSCESNPFLLGAGFDLIELSGYGGSVREVRIQGGRFRCCLRITLVKGPAPTQSEPLRRLAWATGFGLSDCLGYIESLRPRPRRG